MKTLDCRDMPVPKPVVLAQKTLDDLLPDEAITFIVNCDMSEDNIVTFAQNKGYFVRKESKNAGVFITISKNFSCDINSHLSSKKHLENKAFIISSDCIGKGLNGDSLMQEFLESLVKLKKLPHKIIFINKGVKLTCVHEDSETLKTIVKLEEKGVEILVNLNSLDDLTLRSQNKIGKNISMFELAEIMINSNISTL